MGRKRCSKSVETKVREVIQQRRKKVIKKADSLICPKCHFETMFVRDYGALLLIGCTKCNLGDCVPKVKTLSIVDYYNKICDNWRDPKNIPTWYVGRVTLRRYEYLYEKVTLGRIVADIEGAIEDDET